MQISVKQSVSTKSNSQLDMFQEDKTSWSAKKEDKKLQRKLFDLNEILLKDFITGLISFDNASKHLPTGEECSLHMVIATSGGARPIVDVGEISFKKPL